MAFSFNFSGDDIDTSYDEVHEEAAAHVASAAPQTPQAEVKAHHLQELLSTLPSRIAYASTTIESPTGRILHLPRRELFDVRMQLMAEDDAGAETTLDDIDKSDIRTNIYEGGFKTWECSIDLASLLLDRGPRKDIDELCRVDQVIELGAGTALPSLTLLQHALQNSFAMTFTLADYNASVLRLVTLPNVLLTWARFSSNPSIDPSGSGDLEITPSLLESAISDLAAAGITLNFLSGPWSPQLASFIPQSAPDMGTLVLAAETIYSPASTTQFVQLLVELLKRVKMAKAIVAAKRMYFGVGGSVNALKIACGEKGAVAYEVENHGVPGMDQGVGRALVEVQMY